MLSYTIRLMRKTKKTKEEKKTIALLILAMVLLALTVIQLFPLVLTILWTISRPLGASRVGLAEVLVLAVALPLMNNLVFKVIIPLIPPQTKLITRVQIAIALFLMLLIVVTAARLIADHLTNNLNY